jgi:hypothetical protein
MTGTPGTAISRDKHRYRKRHQGDVMADKMIDLGVMDTDEAIPTKASRRKRYPTVWLDAGVKLPLQPEDVGKNFKVSGNIHITGIEESTDEDGKKKEFRFELRSIQIHNERSKLKKALLKNKR